MAVAELPRTKSEAEKKIRFNAASATEPSSSHPDHNEDVVLANAAKGYIGVFDGVGGAAHGEKASTAAKNAFDGVLKQLSDHPMQQQVEHAMQKAYQNAVKAIAEEETAFLQKGMATTATVVYVYPVGEELYVTYLQVGDSSLYAVETDEKEQTTVKKITEDDSYINGILRLNVMDGTITEKEAKEIQLAMSEVNGPDAFPKHLQAWKWLWNQRNKITKDIDAKGKSKPKIHTEKLSPKIKKLLVVSDGVSDNSSESMIGKAFQENSDPQQIIKTVISDAKKIADNDNPEFINRAKPDDLSGAILEIINNKETEES